MVRIRLAAGAERFHEDEQIGQLLRDLGREVQDAIDEVRQFAQGVYPELLTSGGLSAALGDRTGLSGCHSTPVPGL